MNSSPTSSRRAAAYTTIAGNGKWGNHHGKGLWTGEDLKDFIWVMVYGIAPYEVERYVVYPGQACAYMIGQLKIVELREVRAKLGDKFSIKACHNAVLKGGSVPLSALEAEMERAFP
jgi:uncharacterized protein (DUF885 family)